MTAVECETKARGASALAQAESTFAKFAQTKLS